MEEIKKFIRKNGLIGVIRIFFYPISLLISSPLVLVKTLWNCRVLFFKNGKSHLHFSGYQSINFLFYKTRWLNIQRYGLTGISPHIGPGNVNLSRNFHYPFKALDLYMKYGAIVILLSMAFWLFGHFAWAKQTETYWLLICLALTLVGTFYYAVTFRFMNYNALGWSVFSMFVFFLCNGDLWLAALFLLLISFGSLTALVLGAVLCGIQFLLIFDFQYLLLMIPAFLKFGSHFWPFLNPENRRSAKSLKEGVGLTNKVKYKRKTSKGFGVSEIYYLFLYLQFVLCFYLVTDQLPWMFIGSIGVFIINTKLFRFADPQSVFIFILSTALPLIILNQNWFLLISFWILVAPIPRICGFHSYSYTLDRMPELRPYSTNNLINEIKNLIEPLKKEDKLFMAFKDPNGVFENIYDGYRALVELVSYACNEKYIHMIPDWWFINDNNHEGAPSFWGVKPTEVKSNMEKYGCNFAIVYRESGDIDREIWKNEGLIILKEMNWAKYKEDFTSHKNMKVENLLWYLVGYPGYKK